MISRQIRTLLIINKNSATGLRLGDSADRKYAEIMLFRVVQLREHCIAVCAAHRRHVIGRPLAALIMERVELF